MPSIPIIMPQLGESIAEGTVVKWLKQPGDKVGKDESVLEITTDKVDSEIPSPSAGILARAWRRMAMDSKISRTRTTSVPQTSQESTTGTSKVMSP